MDKSKMRYLVENYYTNLTTLTEIQNKINYSIKMTANYSFETFSSSGFSSKVEDLALKNYNYREKIAELEQKILIVDRAIKVLDNKEREIIEKIKIHRNKLSRIGKEIHKNTGYVHRTRERALKKMCEFIGEG